MYYVFPLNTMDPATLAHAESEHWMRSSTKTKVGATNPRIMVHCNSVEVNTAGKIIRKIGTCSLLDADSTVIVKFNTALEAQAYKASEPDEWGMGGTL